MMIAEEVAAQMEERPVTGRRNVDAFFALNGVERNGFEAATLRGFAGPFVPFYVSTVPRGLAGSTSDVDLILVTEDRAAAAHATSNMLFFGSRRVGVKVLAREDIALAIAMLQTPHASAPTPLKWVDLERLVNGTSFVEGESYAAHLPVLCSDAAQRFLADFQAARLGAELAVAALQTRSVEAYAATAVLAAMDTLMAACGRVQWNSKWTLERWRQFRDEARAPQATSGVRLLDRASRIVRGERPMTTPEVLSQLQAVATFLGHLAAPLTLPPARLVPAPRVEAHRFLPSSVALAREGRVAVVTSQVWDALADPGLPSEGACAAAQLTLLQLGHLEVACDREAFA
jgi:hypothetical protein